MDPAQLNRPEGFDEVTEHPRAADGGELERIADQGEPPTPALGQLDQLGHARR